jgi:hypothetical protein
MLAATAAEFLELQPLRRRLPVLGRRIIPLFAITALQRNNLSGHRSLLDSIEKVSLQKLNPPCFYFCMLTSQF